MTRICPTFTGDPTRIGSLAILSIVLALGCANDGSGGTTVIEPPNGGDSSTDWYALTSVIRNPDSDTGFVLRTQRLDGQRLDIGAALEVPGGAVVYGAGDSTIFVGQGDAPILTRYEVGIDGSLTETGRMSLANEGLSRTWWAQQQVQFASPTRAYLILSDGRVIVWNPTEMTIEETIQIPGVQRQGYEIWTSRPFARQQDEIVWTINWVNFNNEEFLGEVAFAVMDLPTGEVSVSPSVQGCGEVSRGAIAESGETVWVTSTYGAAINLIDSDRHPTPCLLRVAPGAMAFSEGVEEPNALLPEVGGLVAEVTQMRPGYAVIRAFNPDALEVEITPETQQYEISQASVWSWHWVNLDTGDTGLIPELGLTLADSYPYQVGERSVTTFPLEDFSETDLVDLTNVDSGSPETLLTAPGFIYSALEVRVDGEDGLGSESGRRMAQRIEPRGDPTFLSL